MTVQMLFPKSRLAALIFKPGGKRVADAIEDAKANAAELRGACLDELQQVLAEIEARTSGVTAYDADMVNGLYEQVGRALGVAGSVGMAEVDIALSSFAVLLDNLRLRQMWDRAAVAVHVQSLRLLLTAAAAEQTEGVAQILEGLRQVSARYAPPPEAS